MRRIQPNGCGYDGFVCKGLTRLRDIFMQTPVDIYRTDNPTDDDWVWTNDTSVVYGHTYSQQQECIDNYAQVPQSFEGFVMTLTPVIDMSGGTNTIEVPEIACRTNMDPFTTELSVLNPPNETYTVNPNTVNTGLIDLYNQVPKYNDDVYTYIGDDREQQHLKISIKPAYKFTIGPGLLEPMLDTMFPPIGVDTIPSTDTMGDFTVWLFDEFNTWKGLVDDRLRNLYQVVPSYDYSKINGLLNLEDAKNREGGCTNFNIHPTYTVPVIGVSITAPSYTIDGRSALEGGKIKVDGQTITVLPLVDEEAPFDAYLDIFNYTSDEQLVLGATITTSTYQGLPVSTSTGITGFTHRKFEYIGSVNEIVASNTPETHDYKRYTLYEIEQGDCIYEVTLDGGTGTTVVSDYKGPFKLKITGTTVYLSEGDALPDEPTVVGGPTASVAGETASRNYEAYTVDIIDGADSVPSSGSTNYAGYVIPDGISYDKIVTHSFQADTSVTAVSYLLLTKTLFGWDDEYVDCSGRAIPDTARTRIPGTTINLAGATVGEIIEGYTVTSIDGGTVSYTNGTTSATAKPDEQYLVQLGIVSGGTVGQVQYGDIFIDKQDIPEPQPVIGGTYSGPFHLLSDLSFEIVETRGNTNYIGDIVINGDERNSVQQTTVSGSTATASFIYAHVTAANSVTFDTDPNPGGTPPPYTVRIASISGTTTTETVVDGHTVYELGPATGSTISVQQYHYGDLYVDGRWS